MRAASYDTRVFYICKINAYIFVHKNKNTNFIYFDAVALVHILQVLNKLGHLNYQIWNWQ